MLAPIVRVVTETEGEAMNEYLAGVLSAASGAEIVKLEPRGEGLVVTYRVGDRIYRVQFDELKGA